MAESYLDDVPVPTVDLELLDNQNKGHLGLSGCANIDLTEGQAITFVLRTPPEEPPVPQGIPKPSTAKEFRVTLEGTRSCPYNSCYLSCNQLSLKEQTSSDPRAILF